MSHSAYTPQQHSITVLISRHAEGRRLSWPGWPGEIPRWFACQKTITHASSIRGGEESNSSNESNALTTRLLSHPDKYALQLAVHPLTTNHHYCGLITTVIISSSSCIVNYDYDNYGMLPVGTQLTLSMHHTAPMPCYIQRNVQTRQSFCWLAELRFYVPPGHKIGHPPDDHHSSELEMWANAQRDGRPAEYRWRPLFNAAVWPTPTTRLPCSNAAKDANPVLITQGAPN